MIEIAHQRSIAKKLGLFLVRGIRGRMPAHAEGTEKQLLAQYPSNNINKQNRSTTVQCTKYWTLCGCPSARSGRVVTVMTRYLLRELERKTWDMFFKNKKEKQGIVQQSDFLLLWSIFAIAPWEILLTIVYFKRSFFFVFFTEKEPLARCVVDDVLRWSVENFHDAGQLFDLVLSREDRVARVQFSQDAT